jgi:hypothetical protein
MQSQEFKDKAKATMIEKYGIEYTMQSQEFKDKTKLTCMEKYGVENVMQSQEFKDKAKATMIEKYGVEHAMQSQEFKDKTKLTCMEKYGVEHAMQSQESKEKFKETMIKRYGVEHALQCSEIFKKQQSSSFSTKSFTFLSGTSCSYQGYEHFYIQEMLDQGKTKEYIIKCWTEKPVIKYMFEGEKHVYYPDGFLEDENKVIEIKSEYTFYKDFEKNLAKFDACIDQGYIVELAVFTPSGDRLDIMSEDYEFKDVEK